MRMEYYFAYGSNMDSKQMRVRCAGAERFSLGRIEGWRFRINRRGVATIVPENGAVVYGIIWHLSEVDKRALDTYEGVRMGLYKEKTIEVRLNSGKRLEAFAYVAADSEPGNPRPGYMDRIIESAKENEFPPSYIEELNSWRVTKK